MGKYNDYAMFRMRSDAPGDDRSLSQVATFDTDAEILRIVSEVSRMARSGDKFADLKASPMIISLVKRLSDLYNADPVAFAMDQPSDLGPMTPILYDGAFNTTAEHHGVYVGYGVVIEVAAETCASSIIGGGKTFRTCLGVSRLSQFGAAHAGGAAHTIKYKPFPPELSDVAHIQLRFQRALDLLEEYKAGWNYNILTANCQHASNKIVSGKFIMDGLNGTRDWLSWLTGERACATPEKLTTPQVVRTN